MSIRDRLRAALPEAMRARDKPAVSALRSALAALDNAEAVPVAGAAASGQAIEQSPLGPGATEAPRQELDEARAMEIVRTEATDRLDTATRLTSPTHADHAARLKAEATVLLHFLDEPEPS